MASLTDDEVMAKTGGGGGSLTDDQVVAKTGKKALEPTFPYDKPDTYYGSVLPIAKDEKTGKLSFAVPEIIRTPARGMLEMWNRQTAPQSSDEPSHYVSPDMLNFLMTVAGRPAPGSKAPSTVTTTAPNAINPERAALAKEAIERFGIKVTGPQIGMNPTTKFIDSTIKHLPFSGAGSEEEAVRQSFNRAVAKTFGEDSPTITEDVMSQAKNRIGGVLNKIEEANKVNLDTDFNTKLADVEAQARSSLTDQDFGVIKRQMDDVLRHIQPGDTLEGKTYANLLHQGSALDRAAGSENSNIAFYAGKIKEALQDALEKSLSGEDLAAYRNARFQYKNMKTIEPLVNKSPDGNINPALLNGRVSVQFPNRAYDTSGNNPLDRLAKIGQAFLKEPQTSASSERAATKAALAKVGELGAAAAAGSVAGVVPTAIGATAALGAGRLAGNYLRSPGFAQKTISKGLAKPRVIPAPAPAGSNVTLPLISQFGAPPSQYADDLYKNR